MFCILGFLPLIISNLFKKTEFGWLGHHGALVHAPAEAVRRSAADNACRRVTVERTVAASRWNAVTVKPRNVQVTEQFPCILHH